MKEKISSRWVLATLMIILMASMVTTSVLAGDEGSFGYRKDINPYDLTTWEGVPNATDPAGDHVNATAVTIVFDNGHGPYVDADKAASFIQLMRKYGDVYISNSTLTPEILNVTRLLVIPSPDAAMTHTTAEIQAIKDYVESGGALFIMGTYYAFFEPSWYDPITSDYGIKWVDGSMRDENDHDPTPRPGFPEGYPYFVLLDTFPDNKLANRLKVGVESIKLSGTSLNITDPVKVYPIVTGDNDPPPNNTVTRDNGNIIHELNGTKTIPLAGVELTGGGKIVASGSDFMIRSDPWPPDQPYGFYDHNEQFLTNLLNYLLANALSNIGDILNVWICNNYTYLFLRVDVAGGLPAPNVLPYFAVQLYVEDANHTALEGVNLTYTNSPIVNNDINASFLFSKWSNGGYDRFKFTGADWNGWKWEFGLDDPATEGVYNWTVGGNSIVFMIYLPLLSSTGIVNTGDTFKFEVYTIWSPDGSNWFAQDYLDFATYTLTGAVVPEFQSLIIILFITPIVAIAIITVKKRQLPKLA